MGSRTWVPTPNADVIYSMSHLDLKETGPLVVAAPRDIMPACDLRQEFSRPHRITGPPIEAHGKGIITSCAETVARLGHKYRRSSELADDVSVAAYASTEATREYHVDIDR